MIAYIRQINGMLDSTLTCRIPFCSNPLPSIPATVNTKAQTLRARVLNPAEGLSTVSFIGISFLRRADQLPCAGIRIATAQGGKMSEADFSSTDSLFTVKVAARLHFS